MSQKKKSKLQLRIIKKKKKKLTIRWLFFMNYVQERKQRDKIMEA